MKVPRILAAKRHPAKASRVLVDFDRDVSPEEVRALLRDLTELRQRNPR